MENVRCPVCKSDTYLNPDLKLYISPCFHKLCEACLHKIFAFGLVPCPECGTKLRKINYIHSTFEDLSVERELKVRKMMHRHFTRTIDEFKDVVAYNDYLEYFEDTVFEMLELKDEKAIRNKIEAIRLKESVLNPKITEEKVVKRKTDDSEGFKKVKIDSIFGIFDEIVPDKIKAEPNRELISKIIIPFEASGMTEMIVTDYFLYQANL